MLKHFALALVCAAPFALGCSHNTPSSNTAASEARQETRASATVMRAAPMGAQQEPAAREVAVNGQCSDWQVYFTTDSSDLSPEARQVLDRLATCIQSGDVSEVSIVGAADPRGSAQSNLELGQRRAEAIRQVLVSRGCDPAAIRTRSVGEANASGTPTDFAVERHANVITIER